MASASLLQSDITSYLKRTNPAVLDMIPTFVRLAEEKIYRVLRSRLNERTIAFIPVAIPPTPVSTPDTIYFDETTALTAMQVPADLEELRFIQIYGLPLLKRITTEALVMANAGYGVGSGVGEAAGTPRYFARSATNTSNGVSQYSFYPLSDQIGVPGLISYWCNFKGTLDFTDLNTPTTNRVLEGAYDLYLYGSLLEAQPYMKNDERIQTWSAMFTAAAETLNQQYIREETSGSTMNVNAPYGD